MIDQQLKEFSEEVKRGFVEALGHKSSFSSPEAKSQAKQDEYELRCERGW